ncbi:MATE family efflux transporter [Anaeromassilibacillus sp. An172]|uniref:MATE family efflux transporter n=1 Tax=Anaeromassilibacillus sp. An172 TaxID=1965570 RepID=UPI001FA8C6F8|nr:MATE family efflux transporter [Anaeromassilibacillus sp. An172]
MFTSELTTKSVNKVYLKYLIPTLLGMLSNSIYCIVDIYFVSAGSGSQGLAAMNICMPVFTILSCVGLLFGVGGATIMSISQGSGDMNTRNKAFSVSVFMMLIVGLMFSVFGVLFRREFAYLLGSDDQLLPLVLEYLTPVMCSALPFVLMYSLSVLLRADNNPKLAMSALMVGNISNIILDYVFVSVFHMGIFGASVATSIAPVLSLIAASFHFILRKNTVHFKLRSFDPKVIGRILSVGIGSGIMELSAGAIIFMFNSAILNLGGEVYLAAYAVITNIAYVFKGLLNGFAQAAQPLISTNFGSGIIKRCSKSLRVCLIYSSVFCIVCYGIITVVPGFIVSFFSNGDTNMEAIASKGMIMYFSSLLFTGINTMLMYFFQSIEQGRKSLLLAVCKGFLFVTLGLWILTSFMGVEGVWYAVLFGEVLTFIIALPMVLRSVKKLKTVTEMKAATV